MRIFGRLVKKSWYLVLGTLLLLLVCNGVNLVWNTYISQIMNHISSRQGVTSQLILAAAICLILTMLGAYASEMMSSWTCETMNHHLRMKFSNHLLNLKLEEAEQMSAGGQMSLLQNEITEVSTYIGDSLITMVNTVIAFVITIIYLWWQSPLLTLASNLPVILILLYVQFSSKIIETLAKKTQEQKQIMNEAVDAMTSVIPVIHLYDCAGFLCRNYDQSADLWQKLAQKEERTKAKLMSFSAVLSTIPILILLFTGGIMVVRGTLQIGVVYIFINLSNNVSGALMNLPGFIANYRRFLANLKRIEGKVEL